jgi:carboxypeptidase PM20D1
MTLLSVVEEQWPIRGTFTISRGSKTHAHVVVVTLEADGVQGRGECVPYARYGETVESVAQRVREIIDDPRVHVTVPEFSQNPSRVSDPESGAYRLLDRTIRETVPVEDLIVIPYLLTGGTDAKYYAARSTNVLRFLAVVMEAGDLERVHGTNERVRVESLASAVQFFHQLILNAEEL